MKIERTIFDGLIRRESWRKTLVYGFDNQPAASATSHPWCYACDEPKISMEHAPPLCFFPEEKDAKGNALYRKNLIRIPSCEIHNTGKSDDDLYVAFHLASTIRGNHCAELVRNGVIARQIEKDHRERDGAFSKRVLRQIRGFTGQNPFGQLDPGRMIRVLDLCARGIYFYERLKPLKLPLRVASLDYDLPGDPKKYDRLAKQRHSFEEEMSGC